jgi:hypothetical protein
MPTVRFLGSVLPLVSRVTIGETPILTCSTEDGLVAKATVQIIQSKIIVTYELNRVLESDRPYLYVRARDFTNVTLDFITFATGSPLTVHLHTVEDENREFSEIRLSDPSLAQFCTAYNLDRNTESDRQDMDYLLSSLYTDQALFIAFNDLTQTISAPHCAETNCGRVLDALRNLITSNPNRKQAWKEMRQVLQISEGYMEWVSAESTSPRHGVPGRETRIKQEVIKRTWNVMNRFLEYRKRGNHPLSSSDFPLLKA